MDRYFVAILVNNEYGVLNRVTSMFRRRQFNIVSLNVSETENKAFSRITVKFDGDAQAKQQLINQLFKLPDIVSVKELVPEETINCETVLIKVANDSQTRRDILDAAQAYAAKTVDYNHDAIVLQLTDATNRIDDFVALLQAYEVLEICRTGVVSLERGEGTLRKASYL